MSPSSHTNQKNIKQVLGVPTETPPRENTSCISGQQGFVDEELPGDAKDAVPDSPPVLSKGNILLDASEMWDISSAMLVF